MNREQRKEIWRRLAQSHIDYWTKLLEDIEQFPETFEEEERMYRLFSSRRVLLDKEKDRFRKKVVDRMNEIKRSHRGVKRSTTMTSQAHTYSSSWCSPCGCRCRQSQRDPFGLPERRDSTVSRLAQRFSKKIQREHLERKRT